MPVPQLPRWTHWFSLIGALLLPLAALAQGTSAGMLQRLANVAGFGGFFVFGPGESGLQRAARLGGLVVGALLAFLGVLFMVLMVSAGLRWMTARGNEQDVEQAKESIKSAAIGLLIVLIAYALVTFISAIITTTGLLRSGP